jgi:phosphoglycolate phosphatase
VHLLEELYGNLHLAIVTNNSCSAAQKALKENNILHYFDFVVGREMMTYLKPSSDGFIYILNCYMNTTSKEWISVGDVWIDGKASQNAGIKFIAYQGNLEKMNKAGVYPEGTIEHISEILNYI